jgi:hypothetical protein
MDLSKFTLRSECLLTAHVVHWNSPTKQDTLVPHAEHFRSMFALHQVDRIMQLRSNREASSRSVSSSLL